MYVCVGVSVFVCVGGGIGGSDSAFVNSRDSYEGTNVCVYVCMYLLPTLGVGLLDFKVSYYSSPAETTSWSAQPHRLP